MTATHSVYTVTTKVGPRAEPYMTAKAGAARHRGVSARRAAQLAAEGLQLDPKRCALIIQDLQNDVIMEGGAFADSGAPAHARAQRVVDNVRRLAEAAPRTRRRRDSRLVHRRTRRAAA